MIVIESKPALTESGSESWHVSCPDHGLLAIVFHASLAQGIADRHTESEHR